MLSLDQLCALPQAGAALLVAHRWLQRHADAVAASTFDLVGALELSAIAEADVPEVVAAIAAGGPRAEAVLSMLNCQLSLDRLQAASLAMGLGEPVFSAEQIAEYKRLLGLGGQRGGDE